MASGPEMGGNRSLDFSGRGIRRQLASGSDSTVIDGAQEGFGVTFGDGEARGDVIAGFHVTGAASGGVIGFADVRVKVCMVVGSNAFAGWGG